ncbi:molybdenum cofactor biosynthesis protein B [Haladaptatus sp. W1]|uniref:MogA/MoaB family molybdenum cofactor biosynthesis protein n=1 Tax=Haladaptatus sp. W1 TaxID=1897478 RepID=UPI000849863C|nr:MogA/MoaB family molybdenum cofactor biosynthesis protein [Haladaptatus sp. W1]ODR81978.1 molybdenum cofactor biosynthesis protein B [Haladaptatus sp. W1]
MTNHDDNGGDHSDGHDDTGHDEDEHGHHDHGDGHDSHSDDEHDHDHHAHNHDHDHHNHDVSELGFAVVTVSSSRSVDDDPAGDAIAELVEDAGHDVVTRELVADDHDGVQKTVHNIVGRDDVDVIVTTGGTGVTPDDVTVEAVRPLLEKELPGFGELFRRLSYDDIGTKIVGTRATAGVAGGVVVCCLPGSENAVRLGVSEIILEEAGHLAGLARRE